MFVRLLSLGTVLVSTAALPLLAVAIRGYGGAPFGRLLQALAVAVVGLGLLELPTALAVDPPVAYVTVVSALAVAAAFAMAARAVRLLTGRQKL
ncbi:MAG: hypothetical protein ABEJ31_02395 [Haloarculaceae archaeon]